MPNILEEIEAVLKEQKEIYAVLIGDPVPGKGFKETIIKVRADYDFDKDPDDEPNRTILKSTPYKEGNDITAIDQVYSYPNKESAEEAFREWLDDSVWNERLKDYDSRAGDMGIDIEKVGHSDLNTEFYEFLEMLVDSGEAPSFAPDEWATT